MGLKVNKLYTNLISAFDLPVLLLIPLLLSLLIPILLLLAGQRKRKWAARRG